MAKKKKRADDDIPILYVRKGATLKEIYTQIKREFSAADLQKYTEIDTEPTVPMETVLADMKRIHEEETRKLKEEKRKSKKKKRA